MNSTIENWIDDLVADVDEAKASEEFQEGLDIQSRSTTTPIGIRSDHPPVSPGDKNRGLPDLAERVRPARPGRRTGHLDLGTDHHEAMPGGENSQSYHENSDCEYDETPPDEWSNDWSGSSQHRCSTSPRPRANHSPTETEATGMPATWLASSTRRTISMSRLRSFQPTGSTGSAKGVCKQRSRA